MTKTLKTKSKNLIGRSSKKEYNKKQKGGKIMPKKIQPEIRLNKVRLQPNKDGVAEILFWGDVHYGHPNCEIKRATAMLDWALKNHVYVMLQGDLLEASTRDSVGDGVYHQEMNPQQQMEDMIEILRPLADAGLIIGLHQGN